MTKYDFAVVGNSVAAMVAAAELARGGNTVALWNPAPQWGAHFGGLHMGDQHFDIGMNLLEFTSFAKQSREIETYTAAMRNDSARFTDVIRDYVDGLVEFTHTETPQSLLNGIFAPDIVIANRLDLLSRLDVGLRQRIAAELVECSAALVRAPAWHARNKLREPELFANADYRAVSIANHGETLHNLLIEPACQRSLGIPSAEISALLHRVAWTPLYYPETLLQQIIGGSASLPPTEFFYPRAGNFEAVVAALYQNIQRSAGLDEKRGKLERLERTKTGWLLNGESQCARLVWAQRPGQLAALLGGEDDLGAYRKASMHIGFAVINTEAFIRRFNTLFVLDADSPIYRITDQTWSAGQDGSHAVCSIEISSAAVADWKLDDLAGLADRVRSQLARLGVVHEAATMRLHALKYFKDAIVAPTASNRNRACAIHKQLSTAHPEVELIGSAAPFGATSFNDYIMQGLHLGRLHSR